MHAGTIRDRERKGINSPIYTSTSFEFIDRDEPIYPRYLNTPNEEAVSTKIAALEETESALVLSSGMAAISSTLFTFLGKNDHIAFQKGLYGGTSNFILQELRKFGIEYTIADSQETEDLEKAIRPNTRLVFIESPSNPLLNITDIRSVAEMASAKGILTVMDNTFASPVNQQPVLLGIDIVIHSATKYLSGHSDICAGAVAANADLIRQIRSTALNFGGSLNGITLYLLERSLKTLDVRVRRINETAGRLAESLSGHNGIKQVNYPGLPGHPGYETACRQMSGFGGMLSFEVKGIDCLTYQKNLKLIRPSVSLGGVESIVSSPAHTSHRHLGKEGRKKEGIPENLIRMSVGVEDAVDLMADLDQAFA